MVIEYDDKGKFYTDVITKVPVPSTIQTITNRLHGNIHVRRDQRLKDELDINEKFLAVTDAIVYAPDGQILYQTKFLAIHRDQIVWVLPDSETAEELEKGQK
jgi:hypothetical protein